MNKNLNDALFNYLMDPKNPSYNFILGKVYEDMGHTAAAASFYIRTGEFATEFDGNELLTYEALLRLALCFEHQGSRVFTTKGILLRAISLMPNRPEAYYLLARMYEYCKEWQESYTFAILGENVKDSEEKLITNVEYPGKYALTFERAMTAWWIGLWDESMYLFKELIKDPNIQWNFMTVAKNNIANLMSTIWKSDLIYYNSYYEYLKVKFPGAIDIEKNYSQCYQDMFVLTMLNGKRNGKYLEIGCGDPFDRNNTALLEKLFGWTGISIDFNKSLLDKWLNVRKSKIVLADATKVNYNEILEPGDYDYLQIDCDPAIITYNVLLKIPFETRKFAVITFEHDHYFEENSDVRRKSRKYFESHGYELIVSNVALDNHNPYEDWWVHPDLVDKTIIEKMKNVSDKPKRADKYMFGRI
jgi:hypothetical protein